MKPRNREINIFNLSMMDVICGALGAFLIIMVVLVPYYREGAAGQQSSEYVRKLGEELERARAELHKALEQMAKMSHAQPVDVQELMRQIEAARKREQQAVQRLQQTEQQLQQARSQAQQFNTRLKSLGASAGSILTVVSVWENQKVDVDMWVRNPNKTWDGPKKETPDGGKLNFQTPSGPSLEMFRESSAFGRYEVFYRVASWGGGPAAPVPVIASITRVGVDEKASRGQAWSFTTNLKEQGRLIPAFAVAIDNRGQVSVDPLPAGQK